jgi:hypothetical protein
MRNDIHELIARRSRKPVVNPVIAAREFADGYNDRQRALPPVNGNASVEYIRGYCERLCEEIVAEAQASRVAARDEALASLPVASERATWWGLAD